jgi:hypothetical protein
MRQSRIWAPLHTIFDAAGRSLPPDLTWLRRFVVILIALFGSTDPASAA